MAGDTTFNDNAVLHAENAADSTGMVTLRANTAGALYVDLSGSATIIAELDQGAPHTTAGTATAASLSLHSFGFSSMTFSIENTHATNGLAVSFSSAETAIVLEPGASWGDNLKATSVLVQSTTGTATYQIALTEQT